MSIEQKVSIMLVDEETINEEITTQNAEGFVAVSITLSGSDVIILFQKVTTGA